jgi:hypothetical protein
VVSVIYFVNYFDPRNLFEISTVMVRKPVWLKTEGREHEGTDVPVWLLGYEVRVFEK